VRKIAALLLAGLAATPAVQCLAQEAMDPELFCQKAGKNKSIYQELLPVESTAQAGATAGAVTCRWTFSRSAGTDVLVTLDSKLLPSTLAARQTILMARLPENHPGKTIEPLPRMGDDGLSRATRENGAIKTFEIEAVQGRRHFLLTVRARDGSAISHRIADASISFLGIGLAALQRP
jgi:hypothetical protein